MKLKVSRCVFFILLVCNIEVNAQLCFSPATNFTTSTRPDAVCSADFNGDNFKDLAVTNQTTNNVSILLGTVTGNFGSATNFAVGSAPCAVISSDFDKDGKADLTIINYNSSTQIY